jgi:hypothetical protein
MLYEHDKKSLTRPSSLARHIGLGLSKIYRDEQPPIYELPFIFPRMLGKSEPPIEILSCSTQVKNEYEKK